MAWTSSQMSTWSSTLKTQTSNNRSFGYTNNNYRIKSTSSENGILLFCELQEAIWHCNLEWVSLWIKNGRDKNAIKVWNSCTMIVWAICSTYLKTDCGFRKYFFSNMGIKQTCPLPPTLLDKQNPLIWMDAQGYQMV